MTDLPFPGHERSFTFDYRKDLPKNDDKVDSSPFTFDTNSLSHSDFLCLRMKLQFKTMSEDVEDEKS
jgi:hypothetical protein